MSCALDEFTTLSIFTTNTQNDMQNFDCTISVIFQNDELGNHTIENNDFFLAIPSNLGKIRIIIFEHFKLKNTAVIKKYQNSTVEEIIPKRQDIYDSQTLIEFFNDYVLAEKGQNVESKRHILITYGHGAGLAFFQTEQIDAILKERFNGVDPSVRAAVKDVVQDANKRIANYVRHAANLSIPVNADIERFDFFPTDKFLGVRPEDLLHLFSQMQIKLVDIDQFAFILDQSFGKAPKTKIELFIATNCYMQTIETGYSLKEYVTYYLASQIQIPVPAFDYKSLFHLLNKDPSCSIDEIWGNISTNYKKKYQSREIERYEDGELYKAMPLNCSINYLEKYGVLVEYINYLSSFLGKNLCTVLSQDDKKVNLNFPLQVLRDKAFEDLSFDDDKGLIDLSYFVKSIRKMLLEFNEFKTDSDIILVLDEMIKLIIQSREIFNDDMFENEKETPGGISFFFPDKNFRLKEYMVGFINFMSSRPLRLKGFYKDCEWDTFLVLICGFMTNQIKCREIS